MGTIGAHGSIGSKLFVSRLRLAAGAPHLEPDGPHRNPSDEPKPAGSRDGNNAEIYEVHCAVIRPGNLVFWRLAWRQVSAEKLIRHDNVPRFAR